MSTPRPLAGKRIVELAQFIAGPTAAQLLADFGAEVVKIEPASGDGSRALPGTAFGSTYFRFFNTTKETRVLDMRSEAGRIAIDELLARADALVCNMAPAALRRAGLGSERLRADHPHLVVTLVSGYGQDDDRACMDTIAQCESGFAWLNGEADGTPRLSTSWPVDFFSGLYAALSTAMALCDRERGDGTLVDISMMEVAAAMLAGPASLAIAEGAEPAAPTGNRDRASSPSGVYACQDGHVYIYGGLDPYWRKLRPIVGGDDTPFAERLARADDFDRVVGDWTAPRSREDVLAAMAAIAVPAGAVRHPADGLARIAALRRGAVTQSLPTGEAVPQFPGLFDGVRPARRPAPGLDAIGPSARESLL